MASIREVAKLAGVSPATVSRVMNGTANVDQEKVLRVKRAIEETGFKPNQVARALFKKSSRVIGVIAPDIDNPFFNEMAKAIEGEAYRQGYRILLCYSENNVEKERDSIRMLSSMNADGIILMTNHQEVEDEVEACELPVVVLDRTVRMDRGIACIQADNYAGGQIATEHLIQCGCRNIVNVCGPQRFSSARQRYQGYLDACRHFGHQVQMIECDYNFADGLVVAEQILQQYPAVDGIMACDDIVAIAIYKVLNRAGYRVPEDIQLIGFDNVMLGTMFTPELTTVEQPIRQMGKTAVNMVINYMKENTIQKDQVFPVRLVQRQTTILKKK